MTEKAIMGTTVDDEQEVLNLGDSELKNFYTVFATLFPNPLTSKVDFTTLLNAAHSAFTAWENNKGNFEKNTLKNTIAALYDAMNLKNLPYINMLWAGNYENLKKSGHKVAKTPEKHGLPSTPGIKEIIKQTPEGTAKVLLNARTGTAQQKKETLTYFLWSCTDPNDNKNLKPLMNTTNKNKLILTGLDLNPLWYCVSTTNSAGSSELSGKVKYPAV